MSISYFVFTLAAMICWGVAPLFRKAAMLRIDPWTGLAMRSFVISPTMLILVIVTGHFRHLVETEYSSWGLICAKGILASLLGHLAYFYAIKYGGISRVIPITSAFPLIAILGVCSCFRKG